MPFAALMPAEFSRIRKASGLRSKQFNASLSELDQAGNLKGGASGAFKFPTADGLLVVKTIEADEAKVLASLADTFADHFEAQPGSLINRFFGLYRMTLYSSTMHFVVISSVWAPAADRRRVVVFDLKGSWVNRSSKPHAGVLKDINLSVDGLGFHYASEKLPLGITQEQRHHVLSQLHKDSLMLSELGIMDYSLLVGVFEQTAYSILHGDATNELSLDQLGLIRGSEEQGRDLLIGIIDVLQMWNCGKRAERCAKTVLQCKSKRGLSAVPPMEYQQRFMRFMDEVFGAVEEKWRMHDDLRLLL